jgi:hypothetical protein
MLQELDDTGRLVGDQRGDRLSQTAGPAGVDVDDACVDARVSVELRGPHEDELVRAEPESVGDRLQPGTARNGHGQEGLAA